MDVEVIVPTLNAGRTLQRCLESLQTQTTTVRVTVVDCGSIDDTLSIAKKYADRVLNSGHRGVSAQRNLGALGSKADLLGFVDADMVLEVGVVSDVVDQISGGAVGVVVPEISFGSTYWARVRAYERSFYEGVDSPEAARFFIRDLFVQAGGYDERLSAVEDFAMDRAIRALGPIGRTESIISHDEGDLRFLNACRKKASYASGMSNYLRIYGWHELRGFLFGRSYFRKPFSLMREPRLGLGVIALKFGETAAVSANIARETQKKTGLRVFSRKQSD
jgi:glycosyltransferase involved in cell wall biosynthesis